MIQMLKEIEINGIKYVPKDSKQTQNVSNKVLVRCKSAGVFFGEISISDLEHGIIKMSNARRIWYWAGANSLSQLAIDGTSKPDECKFPEMLQYISLVEVIEVIPCTEKAAKSIIEVPVWKQ